MSEIRFRVAAKTDVGLERSNNEDNFQVSANLNEAPMKWVNNQEYSLGLKGALLVVADGMGGMNAGEVASEIAINTVRELFSPENITDEIVKTRFTIEKFMKGVIVEADKRIKAFAKDNPESRSMGTTIVIAWLFDGNLYVSWCGDSRAYIYNPNTGLFQITKDHSYVQDLVDAGKISEEDAFDFPDSNIITRSLSDSTSKPNPDCLLIPQKLCNNDIILLCSDGLNGMIRDVEIEKIITDNQGNMAECVDALIKAALDAAGADNCTVALCQILSGGAESEEARIPKFNKKINNTTDDNNKIKKRNLFGVILKIMATCLIVGGVVAWYYMRDSKPSSKQEFATPDTTIVNKPDSTNREVVVESTPEKGTTECDSDTFKRDEGNKDGMKPSVSGNGEKTPTNTNDKTKRSEKDSPKSTGKQDQQGIKIADGIYVTPIESNIEKDSDETQDEKNSESAEKKGG